MQITIIFKRLINYIQVKNAIKNANRMNQQTKKRYYVLKIFNKIRVYDRTHINFLVDKGLLSKKMKEAYWLQKHAIYFTK